MKNSAYHTFKLVSNALLAVILFSGCAELQGQTNGSSESINNLIAFVSYCAKEKTEENRIYFNYPQFEGTISDTGKMNKLISEFVASTLQKVCDGGFRGNLKDSPENWEWDEDEYTLLAMDVGYKITRSDADYFSVTFEGKFNHKFAEHPLNYFNSLIIDVRKCEMTTLSDLYHVDVEFVKLVREKFKEQIRPGLAGIMGVEVEDVPEWIQDYLSDYDDEYLLEILRNPGYRSFLTDTALGVSVSLGHALGDHFEIKISYDELVVFLINGNACEGQEDNSNRAGH